MQRFFKTGEGQYAYGDVLLGLSVPAQCQLARKYAELPIKEIETLLKSKYHEYRLTALMILVLQFAKANEIEKEKIANFYLNNTERINNWDLVDSSADKILGAYYFEKDKEPLYHLAKSSSIWERRMAIIATFYFIKKNQYDEALKISELLLSDKHDLIHKAVGWMLREIGKRNLPLEQQFLDKHYKQMSRTTLRYAIERFPEKQRREYLGKK